MGLKQLEDVTYFRLNNEINRPVNGQIMLHKDKALDAFFKENVVQILWFLILSLIKLITLLNKTISKQRFIKKYRPEFLEELLLFIKIKTSNLVFHGSIQVPLQSVCLEN